jgi:FixJ family two-component response regulator
MTIHPDSQTVHVVDDDPSVRRSLARLLNARGHRVILHESAEAFLETFDPRDSGCAILDLSLPGKDGLQIQSRLAEIAEGFPVVFLTGTGEIPDSVRAMKRGAVDFLTKPVEPSVLLEAVALALQAHAERRAQGLEAEALESRLAHLTAREKEVLDLVVQGRLNKQIAAELDIAEKTVKVHRARVMSKVGAGTLAELVRMMEHRRRQMP